MKVGLGVLSSTSPGMAIGPVDTALGLHALGVDVTIFAEPDAELPERAASLADCVVRLEPTALALPPRVREAALLASRLAVGRRWARAIRRHPVDVIHAFSPGTSVPLPAELPVVVQAWHHPARATLRASLSRASAYGTGGVGLSLPRPLRTPVQTAVRVARQSQAHVSNTLGYRRASVVLVATPSAARFFAARGHSAEVIPPCVAVPDGLASRAPDGAFRIVFCATPLDREWKGLRYLLEALPLVGPDGPTELSLVGAWDRRPDSLLAAVERAGVHVEELGRVQRDAYLRHLAERSDLHVSTALIEEWSYSLFEALSRGVPVIAFDVYPYAETIGAEVGALVPPRDPVALARAIEQARSGGVPSREDVLEATRRLWSAEAIAPRLIEAYERARHAAAPVQR
jgi:glycosyltransferase involved in cell wall biosynthesis